jgi:hypothetical protein
MSDGRLSIYNRKGEKLVEIPATVQIAWVLKNIGHGEFTIAVTDPKCQERYFRYGFFALYEHPRLEPWAGVICPYADWEWSGQGALTIGLLTAEAQLQRRRGPENYVFEGKPGDIFEEIIHFANREGDTRLRVGDVFRGGPALSIPCRDDMLYDLLQKVAEESGHEWWFQPAIDDSGRLYFAATWHKQLRRNRAPYALQEGVNLETPNGVFLRQGGDLVNDLAVVGEGGTSDARPRAESTNDESLDEHGRWQGAESSRASTQAEVDAYAEEQVYIRRNAPRSLMLTAIEEQLQSPDTFRYLRVGAVLQVYLFSMAFWSAGGFGLQASARIIGAEYNSDTNKVILVSQEMVE